MPEEVSVALNHVLARARDPQGMFGGDGRAVALNLLDRLQQIHNSYLQLASTDVPVTVSPFLMFYPFAFYLPRMMSITGINQGGRTLDRLTLDDLRGIDPRWIRATGPRLEGYIQLGYSHLLLWPALTVTDTVIVSGMQQTADITLDPQASLEISSQQTPVLLQLLELLLLHRQRDMASFDSLYATLEGQSRGTQT